MIRSRHNDSLGYRSSRRAFRQWHRYCGLAAALLLVVLAITGVMLNHSGELELGARHIGFAPLLAWYGFENDAAITSFGLNEHWVSCVGDAAFFDRQPLPAPAGCPVGAVSSADMWVLATRRELVLLTVDGELIERLGAAAGVPDEIVAVGTRPGGAVVVDTPSGWRVADRSLLRWQHLGRDVDVRWSRAATAPADLRDALSDAHLGRRLTVERFVQDLHSGRLFGRWGIYVMDAAAVLCLILVISGLVLWRQGHRGRKA